MGDIVEDIIAEPDEPSYFWKLMSSVQFVTAVIQANGWYILGAGALAYYVWRKQALSASSSSSSRANMSPKELQNFQSKEEARRRYVEQLQEKYNRESAEKAEKDRIKQEEKRKARAAELQALAKSSGGGQKLGTGTNADKKKQSFRPEYNPLMGDTSSSRGCSRPSGGRQGG